MDNFFVSYPSGGSGGSMVTSLNGQTGALTLIGGTGITITPGAGTLTIDASGGGGANTFLSNLTSPTAINQDLLPDGNNTRSLGSTGFSFNTATIQQVLASDASVSADFNGRTLYDSTVISAINYQNRELYDTNGNLALTFNPADLILIARDPVGAVSRSVGFQQGDGGFYTFIRATQTLAGGNYTLVLPVDAGLSGQSLTTDGTGVLSWSGSGPSANDTLSNLSSPVAINQDLLPDSDGNRDIGSTTNRFNNMYVNIARTANGAVSVLFDTRTLYDSTNLPAMEWNNRRLMDNTGTSALEFFDPTLVLIRQDATNNLPRVLGFEEGGTGGGGNAAYIKSPQTLAASYTLTLPPDAGATGRVLTTDGTGILTWEDRADNSLSNLSATAINVSLVPNVNGSLSLGSSSLTFSQTFTAQVLSNTGNSLNLLADLGIDMSATPVVLMPLQSSDPVDLGAGSVYYNTTTNKLKVFNGTTWETVTSI